MKIILSPAKKMKIRQDEPFLADRPEFLEEAKYLRGLLKEKTPEELKNLWQCNDKIAQENLQRLRELDLEHNRTLALLAYEGIQYQYMAPQVFTETQWQYARKHVRILSGLYGVLNPTDGVIPYRLEMQAKLENREGKDLYAFWGNQLYESLAKEEDLILNLASKEYSRAVEKYQDGRVKILTCIFGELVQGKVKVKATQAKMARGEMVRWLAEKQIEEPGEIRGFSHLGYQFSEKRSTETEYVFIKQKIQPI